MVHAIRDSPNYRKFQKATTQYATAFYALSELVQTIATDVSDFVLNEEEEEEERNVRAESERGCGTTTKTSEEDESEEHGLRYSKPVPKRLRRMLRCAREPEVMEAVSDFIAVGVMKSVQRANDIGAGISLLAPNSSSNSDDGCLLYTSDAADE